MSDFLPPSDQLDDTANAVLQQQAQRLYKVILQLRWLSVGVLWISIAPLSLWGLRHEFALWLDYFTWTALRYSLIYNPLCAVGLIFCISLTISTAIWQSYNTLFGLSPRYLHRLKRQVLKIRQRGKKHWLWKRICL